MNNFFLNNRGAVNILFAFFAPLLIIIAALVIDFAYTIRIETKLKNIADAAALRGADVIFNSCNFTPSEYPDGLFTDNTFYDPANTLSCSGRTPENFTYSEIITEEASKVINLNDLSSIVDEIYIEAGFASSNTMLSNDNFTYPFQYPSVKVKLTASNKFFFGNFNFNNINITAESIAIVPYPKSIQSTIPIALSDCALSGVWDFSSSKPKENNIFTISTKSTDPLNCVENTANGAWSNFDSTSSSMNGVDCYIPNECPVDRLPESLEFNSIIYIMNGESALYKGVDECIEDNNCSGNGNNVVSIPIIGTPGYLLDSNNILIQPGEGVDSSGYYPIVGFGCANIISYNKPPGNTPQYIQAEFISGCKDSFGSAGGTTYLGVLLPPKLAK
jgi:hypothetical protein